MAQYLCPNCNRLVTYDDNHPCLTYIMEDIDIALKWLAEGDEKDRTPDDAKDSSIENLEEKSIQVCSNMQENGIENSRYVDPLPVGNKEKLSLKSISNRKIKGRIISETTTQNVHLTNAQDAQFLRCTLDSGAIEKHSTENSALEASSENTELDRIHQKDFLGAHERTSFVSESNYEKKKSGSKISNLFQEKANDEYEISLEERKLQSLNKDKDNFMNALVSTTKNAPSDNEICRDDFDFLDNADSLSLHEEPNDDTLGALWSLKDNNYPSEVPFEDQNNTEEMGVNEAESAFSVKEDSSFVGSSIILPSLNMHSSNFHPKLLKNYSSLNGHNRTHTSNRSFQSDVFGKKYNEKGNLNMHYRTHTGKKPYKCDVCEKQFNQKSNLKRHYRTHTGIKPFLCDKCGKPFSQKEGLDLHYWIHTGDKPYVCNICENAFAYKYSLNVHIQTHTSNKPYVCHICKKAFTRKSSLTVHIRSHTGEKPFKCTVCGKAFSVQSNCKRHTRKCMRKINR